MPQRARARSENTDHSTLPRFPTPPQYLRVCRNLISEIAWTTQATNSTVLHPQRKLPSAIQQAQLSMIQSIQNCAHFSGYLTIIFCRASLSEEHLSQRRFRRPRMSSMNRSKPMATLGARGHLPMGSQPTHEANPGSRATHSSGLPRMVTFLTVRSCLGVNMDARHHCTKAQLASRCTSCVSSLSRS